MSAAPEVFVSFVQLPEFVHRNGAERELRICASGCPGTETACQRKERKKQAVDIQSAIHLESRRFISFNIADGRKHATWLAACGNMTPGQLPVLNPVA